MRPMVGRAKAGTDLRAVRENEMPAKAGTDLRAVRENGMPAKVGTDLRAVRENGRRISDHGMTPKPFMGTVILHPFAGPLRNAVAAWSGNSSP